MEMPFDENISHLPETTIRDTFFTCKAYTDAVPLARNEYIVLRYHTCLTTKAALVHTYAVATPTARARLAGMLAGPKNSRRNQQYVKEKQYEEKNVAAVWASFCDYGSCGSSAGRLPNHKWLLW